MNKLLKYQPLLMLAALALMVIFFHRNALSGFWRYDDGWLLDYATRFDVFEYFFDPLITKAYSGYNVTPWNPLVYDINLTLFGLNPLGFYAYHLLVLIALVFATYFLMRLWVSPRYAFLACVVFLIGAPSVHVANKLMVGHYLQGMLFSCLAIYAFVVGIRTRRLVYVVLGGFLYLGATACKEVFVPLPGVLLFLPVGSLKQRLGYSQFYFLVSAGYFLWRYAVLGTFVGGYRSTQAEFSLPEVFNQFANIPGLLFGNVYAGAVALILILISLLVVKRGRGMRLVLIVVIMALVLIPLVPLTQFPGIVAPGRYLFLPWWLIALGVGFGLSVIARFMPSVGLMLAILIAMAAGLQGARELNKLQPELAKYDQLYRFTFKVEENRVLLDTGNNPFYLDVVLNGLRRAQSAINNASWVRMNILTKRGELPKLRAEGLEVWAYNQGCRCIELISGSFGASASGGVSEPGRHLRVMLHGSPYPPLFFEAGGYVDSFQQSGTTLFVEGWVPMSTREPEQQLIVFSPVMPLDKTLLVKKRPDVAAALKGEKWMYSGFQLTLNYANVKDAGLAAKEFCMISRSALSSASVLADPFHQSCSDLVTKTHKR